MLIKRFFENVSKSFQRNKTLMLQCVVCVFLWGLLAHGYMYFSNNISHDSLNEFVLDDTVIKIKINSGRIFWLVYAFLVRGIVAVPAWIGLLSMVFLSVALFYILKIFRIKSLGVIVLFSGILTVNLSMVCLNGTFIHDADVNTLGCAMAVLSVFVWNRCKDKKICYLFGSIPLFFSLGLYQAFVSVTLTLMLFVCCLEILRGEKCKAVLLRGAKGLLMVVCACIAYFACVKIVCAIAGVTQKGGYNFIENLGALNMLGFVVLVAKAYMRSIVILFTTDTGLGFASFTSNIGIVVLTSLYLFAVGAFFIKRLINKRLTWQSRLFAVALILACPLAMNAIEVIANRGSYLLMSYAVWLAYLFGILLIREEVCDSLREKEPLTEVDAGEVSQDVQEPAKATAFDRVLAICKPIAYVLLSVILIGNVRQAHTFYTLKDFQGDATFSLMTRVIEDVDDCEGYMAGETEICFVGDIDKQIIYPHGYEEVKKLYFYKTALGWSNSPRYQEYFDYVMMIPVRLASDKTAKELRETEMVKDMASYPNAGSIKMVNGVVVVKWSEID